MLRSIITRQLHVFTVLRYPGFRLFWSGLQLQIVGIMMMNFTIGWLAFHLTGSPLDLGFVTLAIAVPSVTLTMVGGVFADRLDPRHIITVIEVLIAAVVGVLAFLTLTDRIELWHLVAAAFVSGTVQAFDQPSQQALFPRLLPDQRQLINAVPLMSIAWDFNRIVTPSIAGFVIYAAGAETSFFVSVVAFATMAVVVQLLRPRRVQRVRSGNAFHNLAEGIGYIRRHPLFRVLFGLAYFNSLFGMSYIMLLPIFAEDMLYVDALGLGFLASAGGVGSIAAILSAPKVLRRYAGGKVAVIGTVVFGGTLLAFAFSSWYLLSFFLLVIAGFSATIGFLVVELNLQVMVPDELRGRVIGLMTIIWALPALGAALVASVANFTSPSLALGGAAVLMLLNIVALGIFNPALRGLGVVGASESPAIIPGRATP